jgi:hypothetical protein
VAPPYCGNKTALFKILDFRIPRVGTVQLIFNMKKVLTLLTSASNFKIHSFWGKFFQEIFEYLWKTKIFNSALWTYFFINQNKVEQSFRYYYIFKKYDAQVGRVNTFHILQSIRKGPSNFKLCMKKPLRLSNFLILST